MLASPISSSDKQLLEADNVPLSTVLFFDLFEAQYLLVRDAPPKGVAKLLTRVL